MVAICLRKYKHPRRSGYGGYGGYGGRGGCGRPGFVAPKQQLQYTIYRVLSTAVQQYNRDSSTAALHTTHAGGFGVVLLRSGMIWCRFAQFCNNFVLILSE